MQLLCVFDPRNGLCDLKDLFDLLHRYYDIIPDDPNKLNNMTYGNDSDKERQIADKELHIKRPEEDDEKNVKEIESLRQQVESLEKELDEAKKNAQKKDEDIEQKLSQIDQLTKEKTEILAKLQEHKAEIETITNEKEEKINYLNKQVTELLKSISKYEPTLGNDISEQKYFKIFKINLEETYADDAPFVGKFDSAGNAIFQFNVEKGPHKEFCTNYKNYEHFCEVIESVDLPNHVSIGEWGYGNFNGGTLVVTKPAKIKLTRE